MEDQVYAIHADARSLPFAGDFFDSILCVDSFPHFRTDGLYLNYLAHFVKPGGKTGIAGAGMVQEFEGPVPEQLQHFWSQDCWCLHSTEWWRRHWSRTGILDVEVADTMPEGWRVWLDWQTTAWPENKREIQTLETDRGEYIAYVRMVGCR